MNQIIENLTPPHAFRQRIIPPEYYLQNVTLLHKKVEEILEMAQNLEIEKLNLARNWADQLITFQEAELLPKIGEDLMVPSQIGIALAMHEEIQSAFQLDKTTYEYHALLSILSYDEDKKIAAVRTLAMDGGYYLERTKLSFEALAESVRQGF